GELLMDIIKLIEDFVYFAHQHLDLNELDMVYARNKLYAEFDAYPSKEVKANLSHDVNYFVDAFSQYYVQHKIDPITTNIKIAHLFDLVSPRPSEVNKKFNALAKKDIKLATSYLYELGVNNYYIHKREIMKNVEWIAKFKNAPALEISINVSKPEKNNKDIAKLLKVKDSNYPKCVICLENLGFKGNAKRAPRENIRVIPMKLNNEDWFMQYSPYGYFKEHMILVSKKHEYMQISPRIVKILFAFLKKIPHYTITSNSDLPIVGGSILNHEHFQGGNYLFPLQKAKDLFVIKSKKYKKTKISFLDFYNTAFRLKGKDEKEIIEIVSLFIKKWKSYTDQSLLITPSHNTITPLVRINANHEYEFIMILRNNSVSKQYPDGVYHVHPEYFAIKQEGIGVIEACGRFILPARLIRQMKEVDDVVKHHLNEKVYLKKYPDLNKFKVMIDTLKKNPKMTSKDYINYVGQNILLNTSVFKKDKNGFDHLKRFINSLDL
ncbi:MAG: hypothetical protein MJ208_04145, partial [Bacilli bacterium]|nr:hypothetical protein [Bacilli bacterium]